MVRSFLWLPLTQMTDICLSGDQRPDFWFQDVPAESIELLLNLTEFQYSYLKNKGVILQNN